MLRTLTRTEVHVADQMFATLDPTSRRLRFPREREIIIADTVGFIRDLPPDLVTAFRATLRSWPTRRCSSTPSTPRVPNCEWRIEAVRGVLQDIGMQVPDLQVLEHSRQGHVGQALAAPARKHERIAVAERLERVEDLFGAAAQRHAVLALRLRPCRRHRPHVLLGVDLGPLGPTNLAGPRGRQHQELERQLHEQRRRQRGADGRHVLGLVSVGGRSPPAASRTRDTARRHRAGRRPRAVYGRPRRASAPAHRS